MRVKVDWRTGGKPAYEKFCKKNPSIKLSFDEWKNILYTFNENFKTYILETGDKAKFGGGLGEFAITKKKRKRIKEKDGKQFINLPVDWKKTKEKGKIIYNFNYHTEGFFFGWKWFRVAARFKFSDLWYFKPCRNSSRLIRHYIQIDPKYQHLYKEWSLK